MLGPSEYIAIASFMVGGTFTLLAIQLSNFHSRKQANQTEQNRRRAIFTGLFPISNFIAEKLNNYSDDKNSIRALKELDVAIIQLDKVLEKSEPESEGLMISIIDLGLRLRDLQTLIANIGKRSKKDTLEIQMKIDAVSLALDMLNIHSHANLEYVNLDEPPEMPSPE